MTEVMNVLSEFEISLIDQSIFSENICRKIIDLNPTNISLSNML